MDTERFPCLDTHLSASARAVMTATIKNCAVLVAPSLHTGFYHLQLSGFKTVLTSHSNDSHSYLSLVLFF